MWSYGVLLYEIITFGSFPYQVSYRELFLVLIPLVVVVRVGTKKPTPKTLKKLENPVLGVFTFLKIYV